ncbi:IS3 family transposase [Pedobacter gandavensis]|uniref:IS3 family transposase n=1 Tax=Pedobacter gandavensis TaxID=2679963 RepID=UPI0024792CBA|nr:IS3 family transposase [Pedobacter gandavensis]WGQ09925.1 IS3 family transposase [Pedobacter gandavensis]WGQ10820.1 IS3 family transposase [Pedobacter gandavensis]
MSRERKSYPKEFKLMSVELSNTRSDLPALAKELDITPQILYRWRKEFSAKQGSSFPGNGKVILTETEQELSRLRKELRDTQMERDILKKAGRHLLQERQQIFGFIKNHTEIFPVEKMCTVFKVSRGGFYAWMKSIPSNRSIENQMLDLEILEAFVNSKKIYGSPRITRELHKKNIKVSRVRVARMMKRAKLRSIVKKKFKVTTDSSHKFPVPENILDRDFKPGILGAAWVSDITYIRTKKGWLYLTTVIDLGDRKIIGWALSVTMKAIDTVIPAFKMAQKTRPITQELIFHSDRGVQYACNEFRSLLGKNPFIIRSMSRKGNCWDNAVAESFFKSLKAECVYQHKFTDKEQAALIVFEYIEIWYNRNRLHSALGYLSPEEFGRNLNKQNIAA